MAGSSSTKRGVVSRVGLEQSTDAVAGIVAEDLIEM